MYAQEAFGNKEDKEKLIAALELALAEESDLLDRLQDEREELLVILESNGNITTTDMLAGFELFKKNNKALEYIVNDTKLYNKLSPMAQEQFIHVVLEFNNMDSSIYNLSNYGDIKSLEEEFEKESKKDSDELAYSMLRLYSAVEVNGEAILKHLELEKDYISGMISLDDYNKKLEISLKVLSESLDIVSELELEDYLAGFTRYENGTFIVEDVVENRVDIKTKYPDGIEFFKPSLLDKLKGEDVRTKYFTP